ncbi:reticulon-4-interacting protein 1, mitochondrial-like [Daktulosphaira vitifoliae]|uniref:reticulon-4-interacting protein 1, mitochondrial-like n=1 Tax=Daktulosphaira vitifoliae TaxID=58002 RepID=UPI0021A99DB0|nr:reticulon-4-interacting protein 1, mitochondrial-like [Daktulosphaira vitifoliae]XP_050531058.1 reticulon-4-interacting protein 1, mitochondrial-like [Daktulosphaira vitifoliae]
MGKVVSNINSSIETLKLFWSSILENGSITFERWAEHTNQVALEIWNSRTFQNAQLGANLAWDQISETWMQAKSTIQQYDLNFIIDSVQSKIIYLTGYNFNRTHVYVGFAGLFVGSGVGFLIGINVKPSAITVTHMKAASATSYNGLEGIALLEDVVTPEITKSDQVMIMVRAASIDPVDLLVATGYGSFLRKILIKQAYQKSFQREFPLVLGRDCSGVVIDIGSEVRRDLNINDEVWVCLPPWAPCGSICETIVVSDKYVTHKPRNLSHEQAATLPYSGSLAWLAIFQKANLNPFNAVDKNILVYCGDSGTGSIVVQLCCYLKANVTVACTNRVSYLMKYLGALNTYEAETVSIDQLLSTAPFGYDYVFNTAGDVKSNLCKQLCNTNGTVILVGPHRLPSDSYGAIRSFFYLLWLKISNVFKSDKSQDFNSFHFKILNELTSMANDFVLRPVLDKAFMEHEVDRAFRYMDSGQTVGKVVIKFSNLNCPTNTLPRPSGILF